MRHCLFLLCFGFPALAFAQYKNASFSLDAGALFTTQPSILDDSGAILPQDERPLRLGPGFRIGAESGFKLSQDHLWFVPRVNLNFMRHKTGSSSDSTLEQTYDDAASDAIGTLLGLQGMVALRYVILTDQIRPYLQGGISYMHLFSFSNVMDSNCGVTGVCTTGGTNSDNFLPHSNILGLHVEPGVDFIVVPDIAIKVSVDVQYWILFNASDNFAFAPSLGMTFFL